jgi:hypothetical protein
MTVPFASPFASSAGRTAAARRDIPRYGSTGGARYPLTLPAARAAARPSGGTAAEQPVSSYVYYRNENAENSYTYGSYGASPGTPQSAGSRPVSVVVIREEPASLRPERPGRVRTAPRDAGQTYDSVIYAEDQAAEDQVSEDRAAEDQVIEDFDFISYDASDYGPLLRAPLPAGSPIPADPPPDNHKVPFRNSDFNPFILPQDSGSYPPAKGRRGLEEDEEV